MKLPILATLLKLHYEDPGMEQVVKQAQEAWVKYQKAQLINQFPLREEEQKMPEAIYGPSKIRSVSTAASGGRDAGNLIEFLSFFWADGSEFVIALEVEPQLCRGAEVAGQTQSCVCRDTYLTLDQS